MTVSEVERYDLNDILGLVGLVHYRVGVKKTLICRISVVFGMFKIYGWQALYVLVNYLQVSAIQ